MNKFDEARNKLTNASTTKKEGTGIGWEIGAYTIRGVSVALPAIVIMILENSWVKNGLGLLATLLIIAILIIFRKPLKNAAGYAPGVIPFTIFVIIALFFNTTAQALLTVGISGLGGSVAAIPLHLKYISVQKDVKTPEQKLLETIVNKISS